MDDDLNQQLARLRAENDLDLAAVAMDGLLVGAAHAEELDAEGICLAVGDIALLKSALGAALGRGTPLLTTCEYEGGALVACALDLGAELVLLTREEANLGRLRVAARRFQEHFSGAPVPA